MPGGRPTTYSAEITTTLCERIAGGESLRRILTEAGMPAISTVMLWLQQHPEFLEQYRHAREAQAETLADEIRDISDEAHDRDSAAAAKVRVDARKWIASRLLPKVYGDRMQVQHDVTDGLAERLAAAQQRMAKQPAQATGDDDADR